MNFIRPSAIFATLLALPGVAFAADDTFTVTAEVIDACDITANDLDFGNYSSISGSAADATTTIDVTCTNGTSYGVSLSTGTTAGGSYSERLLTDSSNTLGYNLYTSGALTSVWGDGTSSTSTVTGTGNGSLQSLTVYGEIPASQNVPVGSYSDTVTATISIF